MRHAHAGSLLRATRTLRPMPIVPAPLPGELQWPLSLRLKDRYADCETRDYQYVKQFSHGISFDL